MRVALFCHSLLSDWNHGNAHFLRGIVGELQSRGHDVHAFEPADAWSVANLVSDHGAEALEATREAYPALQITRYLDETLDLDRALDHADLIIVHEWNTPEMVARIGRHHSRSHGVLLFHDTHHRSVSDPEGLAACDLSGYDGVLAFGEVIRERYLRVGWARRAWTWHEAADVRTFHPLPEVPRTADLIWIGNWGDGERTAELAEYLFDPAVSLRLDTTVYGVRYPDAALKHLRSSGITYGGWLANYRAPAAFARHRMTVHIPRDPYVRCLPGIPTIRVFEALACGIPLVSARWDDVEGLFTAGADYLIASDGAAMTRRLHDVRCDPALASSLAAHGCRTILERHTCAHRVDELLAIHRSLQSTAPRDLPVPA
jgi:spore maturation protein CgeB